MTLSGIITALGSIAGIASVVYGIFKYVTWQTTSTPEQQKESVDQTVEQEQQTVSQTGRPQ